MVECARGRRRFDSGPVPVFDPMGLERQGRGVGLPRVRFSLLLCALTACSGEAGLLEDVGPKPVLSLDLPAPAYLAGHTEDRALVFAGGERELWDLDFASGTTARVELSVPPAPYFPQNEPSVRFVGDAILYGEDYARKLWVRGRDPVQLGPDITPSVSFDEGVLFLDEAGVPTWIDEAHLFHAPSLAVSPLPGRSNGRRPPVVYPGGTFWGGVLHDLGNARSLLGGAWSGDGMMAFGREVVCVSDGAQLIRQSWALEEPPMSAPSSEAFQSVHAMGAWCLFRPQAFEDVLVALGPDGNTERIEGEVFVQPAAPPRRDDYLQVGDTLFIHEARLDLSASAIPPTTRLYLLERPDATFLFSGGRTFQLDADGRLLEKDCGVLREGFVGSDGRWCVHVRLGEERAQHWVTHLDSGTLAFSTTSTILPNPFLDSGIRFPTKGLQVADDRVFVFEGGPNARRVRLEVFELADSISP